MDQNSQLRALLAPTIESIGCELWGLEFLAQGRQSTLRIYIEREEGVSIDDCERVSRQVSALLDVEDPIGNAYRLEVSSPGMDRLLFERKHFEAFVGTRVKLRLRMNFEGRRNFSGILVAVEGDEIVLRQDEEEILFPLESIEKAQVVPEFN